MKESETSITVDKKSMFIAVNSTPELPLSDVVDESVSSLKVSSQSKTHSCPPVHSVSVDSGVLLQEESVELETPTAISAGY